MRLAFHWNAQESYRSSVDSLGYDVEAPFSAPAIAVFPEIEGVVGLKAPWPTRRGASNRYQ
jgi:hypothetical protein